MNRDLDLDRYLRGLERSSKGLLSLLQRGDKLDFELLEEYQEQLECTLEALPDIVEQADSEGRGPEVRQRIVNIRKELTAASLSFISASWARGT